MKQNQDTKRHLEKEDSHVEQIQDIKNKIEKFKNYLKESNRSQKADSDIEISREVLKRISSSNI